MKTVKVSFLVVTVLALVSVAPGTQHLVPDRYEHIQQAINVAQNGDTISVWGPPPGQNEPPYIYNENVDYLGKSLVVASRCFLPGWQGCEPTWDSVVIDGFNQVGSVVTMTGSAPAVPRVVLFRLTGEAEGLESPCADRKESVNGRTLAGPEPRPCPPKGSRRELADSGR